MLMLYWFSRMDHSPLWIPSGTVSLGSMYFFVLLQAFLKWQFEDSNIKLVHIFQSSANVVAIIVGLFDTIDEELSCDFIVGCLSRESDIRNVVIDCLLCLRLSTLFWNTEAPVAHGSLKKKTTTRKGHLKFLSNTSWCLQKTNTKHWLTRSSGELLLPKKRRLLHFNPRSTAQERKKYRQ